MISLPQFNQDNSRGGVVDASGPPSGGGEKKSGGCGTGCGTSCGSGLEKIYPTTAVRYGAMRWIGEFSYKPGSVFKCGGKVVIASDRGIELGEQVSLTCGGCSKSVTRDQIKNYLDNSGPEFYKLRAGRILREATPRDLDENDRLNARQMDDISHAALIAAQLNLDMKIVSVEHLLGGERVVFYFRSEQRVDFRDLVRELARHHQTRIEMRQVGARDEARVVADYEICGRECCCKNFLKKMRPVSMRMAKLQKATLDPSKVSGRCGRLRCCLRYEHEGYEVLAAKLPRTDSWVETEFGVAQVIDKQILTQLVLVRPADGRTVTVPLEEIKAFDLPAPVRPPDAPGGPEGRSQRTGGPPSRDPAGPGRRPATADSAGEAGSAAPGERPQRGPSNRRGPDDRPPRRDGRPGGPRPEGRRPDGGGRPQHPMPPREDQPDPQWGPREQPAADAPPESAFRPEVQGLPLDGPHNGTFADDLSDRGPIGELPGESDDPAAPGDPPPQTPGSQRPGGRRRRRRRRGDGGPRPPGGNAPPPV